MNGVGEWGGEGWKKKGGEGKNENNIVAKILYQRERMEKRKGGEGKSEGGEGEEGRDSRGGEHGEGLCSSKNSFKKPWAWIDPR